MIKEFVGEKEIEINGVEISVKLFKRTNPLYKQGWGYFATTSVFDVEQKLYDRFKHRYEQQIERAKQKLEALKKSNGEK